MSTAAPAAAGEAQLAAFPWAEVLASLVAGEDLAPQLAGAALDEVMSGRAGEARTAALLTALRAKGESVAEVAAMAAAMVRHSVPVPVSGPVADIVGTGGDGAGTVNVSTTAALVAAGAGARVVKHGNRASSSRCGSADVLEALGVEIDLGPEGVAACADAVGIGFCFAPRFHPAMRHAGPVRRSLGFRTVFNLLGPLTNPAGPAAMAVGVADRDWAGRLVAGTLAERGVTALVFRGRDGLDELTTTTTSDVWVVAGGAVVESVVDPVALGLPLAAPADLRGTDAAGNAEVVHRVLAGEPGAVADIVALNAAALLAAVSAHETGLDAGRFHGGLSGMLEEGLARARAALRDGAAAAVLRAWIGHA